MNVLRECMKVEDEDADDIEPLRSVYEFVLECMEFEDEDEDEFFISCEEFSLSHETWCHDHGRSPISSLSRQQYRHFLHFFHLSHRYQSMPVCVDNLMCDVKDHWILGIRKKNL